MMIFFQKTCYGLKKSSLLSLIFSFSLLLPLCSCFTGIESTKKINLSRQDRKLALPTPEEKYMEQIEPEPLKNWDTGKLFMASDDKALLVIVPREGLVDIPPDSVKGKILQFYGVDSKINAAGDINLVLLFFDGVYIYTFDTGKPFQEAMENLKSDQVPMLIDLQMVDEARALLNGKQVWTRSSLWYDKDGNRVPGRKFIPVTITNISPGNMVFPLEVEITDPDGNQAFLFMNFGSNDNESRAFGNLFSLSDLRKHYPGIDDETWEYITKEKVKPGMTKEECRLALGNPTEANSGHDYSQTLDIWSYENGYVLWFEDGRLVKTRQ